MFDLSVRKIAGVVGLAGVLAMQLVAGAAEMSNKPASVQFGKLEETDATRTMSDPQFGYVGELGSFQAVASGEATGSIVVHNYPDTTKYALGSTKLNYVGPKRLGNVDGWVFKTQWDGEHYPSKIFFSADEVYFGGGESAYITADYREGTGWAWKLLPMRRMDLVQN
jgi:hypothetical protein